MHSFTLLIAAMAAAVSAKKPVITGNIGVTLYEHIDWHGDSFVVPLLDKCFALPKRFLNADEDETTKISSIRFFTDQVTCAVYSYNGFCLNPPLYKDIHESNRNLHDTSDGDQIKSIFCTRVRFEED